MKQIKLQILLEDLKTTSYRDSKDCPITRALKRAGYVDWKDVGLGIDDENGDEIVGIDNLTYERLANKVLGMMATINPYQFHTSYPYTEPADFEHIIEYD
jgi:hypothetical protein